MDGYIALSWLIPLGAIMAAVSIMLFRMHYGRAPLSQLGQPDSAAEVARLARLRTITSPTLRKGEAMLRL
ncbi:hypothetical protein JW859_04185 [bacterium]|nr:hypothetical protein [bacterium]